MKRKRLKTEHRFNVDEKWRVRLEHIKTEKDKLIARIVSNTVRRSVPSREKTELLERLGARLVEQRLTRHS